jgi:hypothetical protein
MLAPSCFALSINETALLIFSCLLLLTDICAKASRIAEV